MNFFERLFSEPSGKPSSKRVITAYIAVVVISVWAYTSVVSKTMASFSPEAVSLIIGSLGVGAYARGKETPPTPPMAPPAS